MSDIKSLAHSKWNCKYHIVFAPKYRRQIIYGQLEGERVVEEYIKNQLQEDIMNDQVSMKE